MEQQMDYRRGFLPYALSALLIGLVGGFSTLLGPAFVREMGIADNNTTWTALAQAMSTAACAPVLGRLGDAFGRKRTLLGGIAVFTGGNLLSALASSLPMMLAARFLTGIGIAAMAPLIMAYIVARFPPHRVAAGFSLYMLLSSASVVIGPTLGALLIARSGWRVMMWLCAGLSAMVGALAALTGERAERGERAMVDIDAAGAAAVIVFFSLALCLPSVGQNIGWSSTAFRVTALAAAVSFLWLLWTQRRAAQPILPGAFIARRAFFLSVLALFLTQGLMQANMTNSILFLTHVGGGTTSGFAISVMYLGVSLGAVLLGPLADRLEAKTVLTLSLLLTGIGAALLLTVSQEGAALRLMASLGILGLGLGGNGTIFMKVALSGLSAREAGAGTGAYGLFRDLAAPFGVAVFVPFFTNRITALTAQGIALADAAVRALHALARVELLCVAAGIVVVRFLPNIHRRGERK